MLPQGNDHQKSERPEAQKDHLDDHCGQVAQRGSLAMLLQDREEQHRLPHIHGGVQQDQKGSEDQDGLVCGDRREKVRAAGNGSHQDAADSVEEEPAEKQRSDHPRNRHAMPRHHTPFQRFTSTDLVGAA